MKCLRHGSLLAVATLAALFAVGETALGDKGEADAGTKRLPATVAEVSGFIESAKGLRTLDEVRRFSHAQPECLGPLIYRWRLRDGRLDTVTMRSKEGEVIACWGPGR